MRSKPKDHEILIGNSPKHHPCSANQSTKFAVAIPGAARCIAAVADDIDVGVDDLPVVCDDDDDASTLLRAIENRDKQQEGSKRS